MTEVTLHDHVQCGESGDTAPCGMTGVTLHGVVSPEGLGRESLLHAHNQVPEVHVLNHLLMCFLIRVRGLWRYKPV